MIIDTLVDKGRNILKLEGIANYGLEAELLLTSITKKQRIFSIINGNKKINKEDEIRYFKLINRRKNQEPIAYILNNKEFWSINFVVNKNVLIPRPDTEVILSDFERRFKKNSKKHILDIGTGSGCIILSILEQFKNFKGKGLDKSTGAIKIAKYNSDILYLKNRVKFINCDIDNYKFDQYYDVIVSNPPYIKSHKIKNLGQNIKRFEPSLALDGGIDGLEIIKKIINKAKIFLKINGFLYLEIGCEQSIEVNKMLKLNNFRVISKLKDYSKKVRCIIGTRLK